MDSLGWISVEDRLPTLTGLYEVCYDCVASDDYGRYNRGFLGLSWLCYWSDERYGGRVVTHWRVVRVKCLL